MNTTTTLTIREAAQFVLDDTSDSATHYLRVRTENLTALLRVSAVSDRFLTGREVSRDSDGLVGATDRLYFIELSQVRWVKVIAHDNKYLEFTTVMEAK